jgi:3-hydroxyacyl-CoA dehydrogenase / enoyl-CoA hydratase / 3-hydroxybutyryl-CoA epimerase
MTKTQTSTVWSKDESGIVTLTLDDPGSSANTMNALYKASMRDTVERLVKEKDSIRGVIITSAKKTFFAGGDLTLLMQATPAAAAQIYEEVRGMTAQLRALETLGKPVVAALNGTALGGGLEIALACHHRIAIDEPKSEYGLPEVTLGLMPGAGGVVRTVRMFGIQNALMNVIMQGQRMKASQAKAVGLIDVLVKDKAELLAAARAFIEQNPEPKQPWDREGYRMPGGTPATPALAMQLPAFPSNLKKQLKGANMPAPRLIMAAAVEGAQTDFDNASKIETRYFVELVTGREAKNMIKTFFFDLQKLNAGASRPKDVPLWKPTKVAVLGAGMMGAGIAYVTARAGIQCVLKDVTKERAQQGKDYSVKLLDKAVKQGRMTQAAAADVLAKIRETDSAADLDGCDMIIEAVFEDRELKAKVTKEAEGKSKAGALVCTNTSTLPITGLASASKAPKNYIGLHFFSPVDKMPLVEIIAGKETSDEAIARAFDYVLAIKKTPIVVNDSRGFFTSRVFSTFVMEGITMLAEGWNPASIEQAALQNGSPVGPLAVCDEVSLDLTRKVREQTKKDFEAEGKTHAMTVADHLVDRMCLELARKGKAAGAGFYEYPQNGKKHLWSGLYQHFVKSDRKQPSDAEFAELRDRLLYRTSIESIRCLQEHVVRSVGDANIGSIMGIGAPPWTGGTLQYVDYVGPSAFLARARELAKKHGERFEPPQLLVDMVAKSEHFV